MIVDRCRRKKGSHLSKKPGSHAELLRQALATLTPKQLRRLKARFVEGKKYREIAEMEGIDISIAHHSVRDAIRRLQKYFIQHGWMEKPRNAVIGTKL